MYEARSKIILVLSRLGFVLWAHSLTKSSAFTFLPQNHGSHDIANNATSKQIVHRSRLFFGDMARRLRIGTTKGRMQRLKISRSERANFRGESDRASKVNQKTKPKNHQLFI